MNEKLLKKVLANDPREKRDKTPQEIVSQWQDRRLIGVVLKWIAFGAALVFLYWYAFERRPTFTFAKRLPFKARWSLGLSVGASFAWVIYCFFGYRCPRCQRYHQVDWSLGGWLFGVKEPPDGCRHCNANFQ